MEKIFFLFFAIALTTTAQSNTPSIDFKCVNRFPQTSFILKTEGSEAVLTTIHHNGTKYMPIHEGVVVPNDISYLKDVANVLTLMGDRNEFRFPIAKCKIYGPGQMSCANGSSENFQGREMRAFYLHTSKITEQSLGRTFERLKVTFSVNVANFVPVQDLMMYYDTGECTAKEWRIF